MYNDENSKNMNAEDKSRGRHTIQMQMAILDSDTRKMISEKNVLEAEIKKIKMDEDRLRIELEEKRKKYDNLVYKIAQSDVELKNMKKKLNLL
jgi:hypothetical protein